MTEPSTNNPFESPTPQIDSDNQSQHAKLVEVLAGFAWILPIVALGLFFTLVVGAIPGFHNILILYGIILCFAGGVLFTLFGVVATQWFPMAKRHAMYGIAFNGLLIVIVGTILAIAIQTSADV